MLGYPLYTYVAVLLIAVFVVGCLWSIALVMFATIMRFFTASWVWLCTILAKLTSTALSSAGTAHFASSKEIATAGAFNDVGLPLGTWTDGRTIREPRGSHVSVIAPPRSGKSFGIVMPVLREQPTSTIVTDLRGELYLHTHEVREEFGPVYRFDPGSEASCSINVLDSIRWNTQFMYGDVDRVANHVLAPTGSDIGDEFRRNAIPLLRAILVDRHHAGEGNFPALVDWMLSPDRTIDEKIQTLLTSTNPYVQRGARRTADMSARLRQGVWNAILEPLSIFEDPVVRSHTQSSDVELQDLLFAPDPITIYLCLSFHEIDRLGRFLGLFIEVLVSIVSAPHAPARHKVLLVLDEMANLGKLSALEQSVSYLQGSGAQCLFVFQNINQILNVYGPHTPLLSSVSNFVFYCPIPIDIQTAKLVSDSLGTTTIPVLGLQTNRSFTTASSGESISDRGRPLLTTDEVTRLPKSDALILLQEQSPIHALKLGQQPPSTTFKVGFALARHPQLVATAAIVLLLWFATAPLRQHSLVSTMPQMASMLPQSSPVPPALVPLTAEASNPQPAPTAPQHNPALAPMPTGPSTYPGIGGPWLLETVQDTQWGRRFRLTGQAAKPHLEAAYGTEEYCTKALVDWYTGKVSSAKRLAHKLTDEKEDHQPLKRTWSATTDGEPAVITARCFTQATGGSGG